MFFGTPHFGSKYADNAQFFDSFVRAVDQLSIIDRIWGSTRPGPISLLKDRSDELQKISTSFAKRTTGVEIISFCEERVIRGLKELVRICFFTNDIQDYKLTSYLFWE